MKKHNDDWEEFLKQREQEKPLEDKQLEELLKHDHKNKNANLNKEVSKEKANKTNTSQTFNNLKEENKNINFPDLEKLATPDFDVDNLSEQELLGDVTNYDEANIIYEDTYAKYEEAFQNWETDPDNEELQRKLDIASNINDIAQKRLEYFQEKELADLKQKRIAFEQSLSNNNNSKKAIKSRLSGAIFGIIILIALANFFTLIFLSANGYKKLGTALFPCIMVIIVFICIYKFFISPQFKALQNKNLNNNTQTENTNSSINKQSLAKAKLKIILLLCLLAGFLFLAIFGGVNNNLALIFTGIGGFVGSILLLSIISKLKNKHNQTTTPIIGIVKSCNEETTNNKNGYLENLFKVVIEANNNFYICYSKNNYNIGDTITIYIDPKNSKKCYIKE